MLLYSAVVVLCMTSSAPAHAFLLPFLVDGIEDLAAKFRGLPIDYDLQDGEVFDYIVVGAGAAGSAAAARLALAGYHTLLVEAGGDPSPLTKIPMAAMGLLGSPDDWQYRTRPNGVSCLGFDGDNCPFSRGKALGGSTSINYMLYVRGNPADYEYDMPGWTWDEFRPYFLRYEGLKAELPRSSVPYHNTTGTMRIDFFDDPENEWHRRIVKGFKELNFPWNPDVNAESQIGITRLVGYTYGGERMSTARGYLARDDVKATLKVAKGTRCTGVVIDDDNVATGVTVARGLTGRRVTVSARQEVILSAGTIGTPQILLLSGIGPADHLRSLGIKVRADLPVGQDLSEHVLPLVFMPVERNILKSTQELVKATAEAVNWGATRNGTFASNGLTDISIFLNTHCYDKRKRRLDNNDPACELPTLQLLGAFIERGLVGIGRPFFKNSIPLKDRVLDQLLKVNAEKALLIISPAVLDPRSRGNVSLASADPLAAPLIFPNFLSDERDVDETIRAITILEHLAKTKAFSQRGAKLLRLKLKGCPSSAKGGEAYWRCYVRHLTFTVFHATGTAALGRVLDECLRVRGVTGLRVADLSALRRIPRGNTEAAAVATGERLADFLLGNGPCSE